MTDSNELDLKTVSSQHPIVFFDGVCGLCNATVDWIMPRDAKGHFRFSPLQGKAAVDMLTESERRDLDSVILVKNGKRYKRSDAIVEVLLDLGPWRFLGLLLKLVPRSLRDLGYQIVAKVRYRVWGEREMCRLPSKAERERFID